MEKSGHVPLGTFGTLFHFFWLQRPLVFNALLSIAPMDGHAVLASLRSNVPTNSKAPSATLKESTPAPPVEPLVDLPSGSARLRSGSVVSASGKRAYKPRRASHKGMPHKPHKPHTGKRDGMAAVRKRALKLTKRIGVRTKKLSEGGGLPANEPASVGS